MDRRLARLIMLTGCRPGELNDAADLTKLLESFARVYAAADLEAIVARVRDEVRSELMHAELNNRGAYQISETRVEQ
jgi:hypothetical protein